MLEDVLARAHVVALPMRVRFRGVDTREALLIDGPAGWGEFAPFLEYGPAEAAHWLRGALEAAYIGFPTPVRTSVPVNATVPAVKPSQVPEILDRFPGCDTIKIKVAEGDDAARVQAVRDYNPQAIIRVDANQGWTVSEAVAAAKTFGELDYMEQPCATVPELAEVRKHGIRVAADESIRRAEDPYAVAHAGAADVAVVKVAPLGGVSNVLKIADFMHSRGLTITVASALDTAVGMNAGLAAVAALEHINPAGLATQQLFLEDVCEPREIHNGMLDITPQTPDPDRLAEFASPRKHYWFERLRQAWEYL
ncbi:o-succinylbenzoate synthase [Corynebacterium freiburgense]|uniref:o-succinylbenzoate synthase n=1 Tax=Corynebacterium freiburgense TaxID=556548 RepID=UPI00042A6022|nr:o-succinylbenzoate synthase [Corynebacterium freiburgense]WJZ01587.1 Muconate cycloisomerase 1 [Corynebacterium freiburgense]